MAAVLAIGLALMFLKLPSCGAMWTTTTKNIDRALRRSQFVRRLLVLIGFTHLCFVRLIYL